ncbi:MAG: hypothetical protein ACRDLP_13070 [Solirubrobacteraceae bacterium]
MADAVTLPDREVVVLLDREVVAARVLAALDAEAVVLTFATPELEPPPPPHPATRTALASAAPASRRGRGKRGDRGVGIPWRI